MSWIQALLMGIIQGVTEFLPISSSGHLAIFEHLFKININTGMLFEVMLNIGKLVVIIVVFKKDLLRLLIECLRMIISIIANAGTFLHNTKQEDAKRYKKIISNNYRKFAILLLVSTISTGITGCLTRSLLEPVNTTLLTPGIGLLITGILLLIVDYIKTGNSVPKDVSYWQALAIGFCQGVAIVPGISGLGVTLVACLLCGFGRKFAIKYALLVSIPAVLGAAVLECLEIQNFDITWNLFFTYSAAAIVAGVVGYFCIKPMLRMIRKRKFKGFSYYCFFIGIVAIVCYFIAI